MRVLLMLITFLAISVPAKADIWRTYQVPDAPDFVFALPESYTVFYYDSPSYESLPSDLKSIMNILLASNKAFAIAYSADFTEYIIFSKLVDYYGYEYNAFSDADLLQTGNDLISSLAETEQDHPDIKTNFDKHYILRSDYTSFVIIEGFREVDGFIENMTQYASCFKNCMLIMQVSYPDEELSPDSKKLYDAIANSIIRIE